MVIIPLLAFKLKATHSGNPTNDFYWMQKFSSLKAVQCNTAGRRIIFYRSNLYNLIGKFEQPGYVAVRPRSYSYLAKLKST